MRYKRILLRLLSCLLILNLLCACSHDKSSHSNHSLVEGAKERINKSVINSLIDPQNAHISDVTVEFEGNDVVVLSCIVTATNSFGGISRNIFEFVYTSSGDERVDNVSSGTTPYSKARALAADSIYTDGYKRIVQKEILYFMKY